MTRAAVPAERQQARAQRGRAKDGEAKRRLARIRAPRAPEPSEILDSPGRPLDPGLRREMEGQLGHDFTRVLIHTDRDAATLAGLLGADAVTMGQDVFFADGTYQPWSAVGRRLLAHELLHTVQAPYPPGALRAGRDAGVVSLPHEPLEREAEGEAGRADGPPGAVMADGEPQLEAQAPAVASWLRYATVTAEQQRNEQLDPATLVDRLVAGVLRSLRGDPEDSSKRVRLQLARLGQELRSSVLDKLEVRLPSQEHQQVVQVASDLDQGSAPLPVDSAPAPESVSAPDPQREQSDRGQVRESDTEHARQLDQDTEPRQQQAREEQDKAAVQETEQAVESGKRQQDETTAAEQEKAGAQATAADADKKTAQDKQRQDEKTGQEKKEAAQTESAEKEKTKAKGEKERSEQDPAGREREAKRPGGPAGTPAPRQGPVLGAQPIAAAPVAAAGGTPPVDADQVDMIAEAPEGPLARHRITAKPGKTDEQQPSEVPPGEQPEGLEADPVGQVAEAETPAPALPELPAQQPIPPNAYLPKQDMDVSGVPTAGEIKLPASGEPPPPAAAPSFPAPPEPGMREERPGEPDPVEMRLQEQDRREGATIEPAPGQVSPDAAEQEAEAAPEPTGGGPGPEAAAGTSAGTASAAGITADTVPGGPAGSAEAQPTGPEPAGAEAASGGTTAGGTEAGSAEPGAAGSAAGAPGAAVPGSAVPGPDAGAAAGDASMEAGGGACAGGPEPAAANLGRAGADGGGGGGAPAAAAEEPQPAAPDVSQQEPQAALATAGQLPATAMMTTLGGVDAAVSHSVGQERDQLAESPPQLERPSGAPQTLHGPPAEAAPASYAPDKLGKASPQGKGEQKGPEGKTVAGGPAPTDQVQAPKVTGDQGGNLTDADVQNIQHAVGSVPTTDPVLDQASVAAAPTVQLSGETDPALTDQQQAKLHDKSTQILSTGRDDAARPLGEDQIYPDVPPEVLKAQVPATQPAGPPGGAPAPAGLGGGAAGAGAGGPDAAGDQAVSAVAQQERGPQIQAAVGQGQSEMAAGQQDKQQQEQSAQQEHRAQLAIAIKEHTDQQTAERATARDQAHGQRLAWQEEQGKLVTGAGIEAGQQHDKARADITQKKADTDHKVGDRQQEDNKAIADQRRKAEEDARKERDKKKDSDSWLGKIVSVIKDAFNALVSAIKGIFDAARRFVQGVIDKFKSFVTGLIDAARNAIVGLIKGLTDALIAIGDKLLAAFPGLRDKFRRLIENARDSAIRTVNKIADNLKSAVTKLLDLLGKALTAVLALYETALLAAVKYVRATVQGVINFVKSAIAALGEFAALIKDVAADPIGWIKKLGAAVVDGIRNYLWDAIKAAVKQWFDEKVQAILGLGRLIINVLIKGCISFAKIARMAWDALIKALPMMLIQIVIERLVSLIVPAAGAIMAIVQGVIAAYNTISKIIAAIGKFVVFLKAVRSGQGARPFAAAVAAGVVALLNFVANFLMSKLGNAAKGVASKLKGIADRILKFLARGARAVKKGIGTAFNLAKRGAKAAAGAIKKGFQAVVRAGKRGAQWLAKKAKSAVQAIGRGARAVGSRLAKTKLGKFVANIGSKIKAKYHQVKAKLAEWRDKFKKWREDRKKNKPNPEQRLQAAAERIRPKVQWMLDRGIPRPILGLTLMALRAWYRLTQLSIIGRPASSVHATLNPEDDTNKANEVLEDEVLRMVREEVQRHLGTEESQAQIRRISSGQQDPKEVDTTAFQTRRSPSSPQTPPTRISRISVPSGVPPGVAAAGLTQQISGGSVARNRIITLGGEKGIVMASVRTTGSDPIGMLRLLRRDPQTGIWTPVPVPHNYAEQAKLAANTGPELADGLKALRKGDYEAVAELPHAELVAQAGTQWMVAEPGRSPYAHVTSQAGTELALAAARGEQAGVPLSETLREGPFTKPGSVSASRALIEREKRTPEQRAAGEQPFHRKLYPGAESVEGITQRIMNILRVFAVLSGLMTAEGAKQAELEKLRDVVQEMLTNPEIRARILGPH